MPLWGIYLLKYSVKKQLLLNKIFAVLCANNILISCGNEADTTWKMSLVSIRKIIKLVVTSSLRKNKKMCPFLALLISSWKARFRTLLPVSPNFSSKLLWTLLPFSKGILNFFLPKNEKMRVKKRSRVILYCWAGKRGTARLKGSNQSLAI